MDSSIRMLLLCYCTFITMQVKSVIKVISGFMMLILTSATMMINITKDIGIMQFFPAKLILEDHCHIFLQKTNLIHSLISCDQKIIFSNLLYSSKSCKFLRKMIQVSCAEDIWLGYYGENTTFSDVNESTSSFFKWQRGSPELKPPESTPDQSESYVYYRQIFDDN